MGTHPIFESDFDCLTEGNAFLSYSVTCLADRVARTTNEGPLATGRYLWQVWRQDSRLRRRLLVPSVRGNRKCILRTSNYGGWHCSLFNRPSCRTGTGARFAVN